jgi:hypothetical protein
VFQEYQTEKYLIQKTNTSQKNRDILLINFFFKFVQIQMQLTEQLGNRDTVLYYNGFHLIFLKNSLSFHLCVSWSIIFVKSPR